jgi:hypothetical protein
MIGIKKENVTQTKWRSWEGGVILIACDYGGLKYIPFSPQDIKVTKKSMDTGDEAPAVFTLFNTYIPLGDTVPVRLSNKCLFFFIFTFRTTVHKTYVVTLLEN